jgi:hypothetical protein
MWFYSYEILGRQNVGTKPEPYVPEAGYRWRGWTQKALGDFQWVMKLFYIFFDSFFLSSCATLTRLVLNFWAQMILLPQPWNSWDYRNVPHPGLFFILIVVMATWQKMFSNTDRSIYLLGWIMSPQISWVEDLSPSTSECELTWKTGFLTGIIKLKWSH